MLRKASAKQLFQGQTTHALSAAELAELCNMFEINDAHREQLNNVLSHITSTPTGAEQGRQLLAYCRKTGKISIKTGPQIDDYCEKNRCKAYKDFFSNTICFQSGAFDQKNSPNPYFVGSVLLHEALHCRQTEMDWNDHAVLIDAETYALSNQLDTEVEPAWTDGYAKSFKANYEKWLKIADNPDKLTPTGALKFQPTPGLSRRDLHKARQAYAHEMAALETRGQFIHDFTQSPEKWGASALKYPSLYGRATQQKYLGDNHFLQYDIDNDLIRGILARNPGVNPATFTKENIIRKNPEFHRLNGVPFGTNQHASKQETTTMFKIYDALAGGRQLNAYGQKLVFDALSKENSFRRAGKHWQNDPVLAIIKDNKIETKLKKGERLTPKEVMAVYYALLNNSTALTREEYLFQMTEFVRSNHWEETNLTSSRLYRQIKSDLNHTIGSQAFAQTTPEQNAANLPGILRNAQQPSAIVTINQHRSDKNQGLS